MDWLRRVAQLDMLVMLMSMVLGSCTTSMGGLQDQDGSRSCLAAERQALLDFKGAAFLSPSDSLLSWDSSDDCCVWDGIDCDKATGHVITLDLHDAVLHCPDPQYCLGGEIGSSLLALKHLTRLDLSTNSLHKIPQFIGSFPELAYLNLSNNPWEGSIPYQLGNLSKLLHLDRRLIDTDDHECLFYPFTDNLDWISRLSSLETLKMSCTNFTKAKNWLQVIQFHPSLSVLHLDRCHFPEPDPSSIPLSDINSSNSLKVLHLTRSYYGLHSAIFYSLVSMSNDLIELKLFQNHLNGPIPDSFGHMPGLQHVDFSRNNLSGGIPKSLGSLCNLETLDLAGNNLQESLSAIMLKNLSGCAKDSLKILAFSENQIRGSLPDVTVFSELRELYLQRNQLDGTFPVSFEHVSKLSVMHLEQNQLEGPFPNAMGKLYDLEILDVSSNSLNGIISEAHLSSLHKLKKLIISFNSLSLNVSSAWIPSFQLDSIQMASCKLGPKFPSWLRTQKNFSYLDISNSGISETIPSWFIPLPSNLIYLNLSFNNIRGKLPHLSFYNILGLHQIDLSSNLFSGSIPQIAPSTTLLNLHGNQFSGTLFSLFCGTGEAISYLDLSDNLLSGNLRFGGNNLKWLVILNLENNNFSGSIPDTIDLPLPALRSLHMRNNSFSGTLPWPSLSLLTELRLLDVGENKLSGFIPSGIGEWLTNLVVLRLRSNGFVGNIPSSICSLKSLQILDLSMNNITGVIPSCLCNLTAMSQKGSSNATIKFPFFTNYALIDTKHYCSKGDVDEPCIVPGRYGEGTQISTHNDFASVMWKGVEQEYGNTLGLLKVIDLSGNKLRGGIPEVMTRLLGLITLNLSRNNLSGSIPREIGRLEVLESLDLSENHLFGRIPESLAYLTFLSVLDLSNNNFSGRIPSSTQLQSFNATSYVGNPGLCGDPLTKKCLIDETRKPPQSSIGGQNENADNEEWFESFWFHIGMVVGFITGFWGVFGTILLNRSLRHKYFRFLSSTGDWIWLTIALKVRKLARKA